MPSKAAVATPPLPPGEGIPIAVKSIIDQFPVAWRNFVKQKAKPTISVQVPLQLILPQLMTGSVRFSFNQIKSWLPDELRSFPNAANGEDPVIDVPLQEILPRLKPEHYPRPNQQRRIQIPDDIASVFGKEGSNWPDPYALSDRIGRLAPADPSVRALKPQASQAVEESEPSAEASSLETPKVEAAPELEPSPLITSTQLPPVTPTPASKATPAAPVETEAPKVPFAPDPSPLPPMGDSDGPIKPSFELPSAENLRARETSKVSAPVSQPPSPPPTPAAPIPAMAPPEPAPVIQLVAEAAPAPAPPIPRLKPPIQPPKKFREAAAKEAPTMVVSGSEDSAQELVMDLKSMLADWPENLATALKTPPYDQASIAIPMALLEVEMRKGAVQFPWRQIRSWIRPALPAEVGHDFSDSMLDIPLWFVAPKFMAARKKVTPKKKVNVGDNIPNLFSLPSTAPAAETAAPQPAETPASAAEAPDTKSPDVVAKPAQATQSLPMDLGTLFGNPGKKDWTAGEIVQGVIGFSGVKGAVVGMNDGLLIAGDLGTEKGNAETTAAFIPQTFSRIQQLIDTFSIPSSNMIRIESGSHEIVVIKNTNIYLCAVSADKQTLPIDKLKCVADFLGKPA